VRLLGLRIHKRTTYTSHPFELGLGLRVRVRHLNVQEEHTTAFPRLREGQRVIDTFRDSRVYVHAELSERTLRSRTPSSLQREYRADGRVDTPSRVAPPVGRRHQLRQRQLHLLTIFERERVLLCVCVGAVWVGGG